MEAKNEETFCDAASYIQILTNESNPLSQPHMLIEEYRNELDLISEEDNLPGNGSEYMSMTIKKSVVIGEGKHVHNSGQKLNLS